MALSSLQVQQDAALYFNNTFNEELALGLRAVLAKDNNYTLFRWEDRWAWATFSSVFACLIAADAVVLNRNPRRLTLRNAVLYSLFWIACAFGFCGWVWHSYGQVQASMWMSGYILEWMLSFDNIFVFHLIFKAYGTPDHLKQRPLYFGICGAVFFRLVFLFVGEYLMHAMFLMHIIFGFFLVYTGLKTFLVDDDDDEDPTQHPLVQWLQQKLPFVAVYDTNGAFFIRVPEDENGKTLMPDLRTTQTVEVDETTPLVSQYGTVDVSAIENASRGKLRATMLFLVVCCLEISDLLFAVDSVSAIVAQVNDLFLAYTSAVFAMLGLRAVFFIIDALVSLFTFLKYGVGLVLMFVGAKLVLGRMVHVPAYVVCLVLVVAIAGSMLASVAQTRMQKLSKVPSGLGSDAWAKEKVMNGEQLPAQERTNVPAA
eukprot:TRINITY_DN1852_c0_g1_i4.p1 TRINITY_DN1852_c0_g1~~TRINITY_DN1852_c0_g1_i4.p1  ORF type:complete len:449 (+),score=71.94 TRINITY_DN1852_c0_g1_i4:67-1347(+)